MVQFLNLKKFPNEINVNFYYCMKESKYTHLKTCHDLSLIIQNHQMNSHSPLLSICAVPDYSASPSYYLRISIN
jgi:hypothetical protein